MEVSDGSAWRFNGFSGPTTPTPCRSPNITPGHLSVGTESRGLTTCTYRADLDKPSQPFGRSRFFRSSNRAPRSTAFSCCGQWAPTRRRSHRLPTWTVRRTSRGSSRAATYWRTV